MTEIRPRHDLSPGEIDALEDRLYRFNAERTGFSDGEGLCFVAENAGQLIGGVAGYSWGGICELRQVWVAEAHRGRGPGPGAHGGGAGRGRATRLRPCV